MKYQFTDRTKGVLQSARDEALALGHDYVGTEHILLGLVREREGGAAQRLAAHGATEARVRREVDRSVRRGRGTVGARELPYTSRAKKVLELAMADGREKGAGRIGTSQLLAGLVREEKGIAAQILRSSFGIDETALSGPPAPEAGAPPVAEAEDRPVWYLEIDAAAATPIYEQIVAKVEEAVAMGRLEPGERLPTVRQLAEELEVAPGTVARAYSELERRGVIETAGARGTRVAHRAPGAAGAKEEELEGLLRPVAIAAFHLGASADQLRSGLERAMKGIFG